MLEVRLLGQFDVCLHGQPVEIPSRPAQSLFSYLILNAGIACRREMLAGILWPDSTDSNARSYLRQALWRVKQALGGNYLSTDNISITFDPDQVYWLDVALLEKPYVEGLPIERLLEEVAIYKGQLLPGFYDEWIFSQRERLHSIYEHKIEMLLTRLIKGRQWQDVLKWGEHWIASSPAPEPAYRALMQAHSGTGNRAGVATVYQRCKETLWIEVGVEPSNLTQQMAECLLSGETGIGKPSITPDSTPLGTPLQITPFVGRQRELAEIASQLKDPACRLLTLIGPGGVGKTRLALEVTGRLDYEACFVPLSSITSPALLVSTIADMLGLSLFGGQNLKEHLLSHLQDKSMVLVLDNLEHLLSGVGPVADILRQASGVKILATSRVRLNIEGEWLYEVAGMDFPLNVSADHLEEFSAVKLFLGNARRIDHNFSLLDGNATHVAQICQMVEGLPLAIELASAWVRILPCQDIVSELENSLDFLTTTRHDLPSRHRSLRAVFVHSWELMPEQEQEAFKNLSIFRGGFTRDAASQVADTSLHTLSSLADRSLIRWSQTGRYYIHPTLDEYGKKMLDGSTDEKEIIGDLHCGYYARFIQHHHADLTAGSQKEVLKTIEYEIDNLRAAWQWAVEHVRIETLDEMIDGLYAFYLARGWFDEGVKIFDQAAALLGRTTLDARTADHISGRVLTRLGHMRANLGHYDRARQHLAESLELTYKCESLQESSFALNILGGIAWDLGKFPEALRYHQVSEEICRVIGHLRGLAQALDRLGFVYMSMGQFSKAELRLKESLRIYRELGDYMGSASPQGWLGWTAWGVGDFNEAQKRFRRAIEISTEFDNRMVLAVHLAGLSVTFNAIQQYDQVKKTASECLTVAREIGYQLVVVAALGSLADAHRAEGELQQARKYLIEGFEIASKLKLLPMYLLLLIAWGSLLADEGKGEEATEALFLIMQEARDIKAFSRIAQSRLNEFSAKLPAEVFLAARERGETVDIETFVHEILD